MRYDKPIFFQHVKPGEYDAATGNYGDDTITEEKRYASISDTGAEALNLIYGKLKQGSLTIRLQRPFNEPFDRIRIGDALYNVDFERHKKAFVVSGVQ